MSSPLLPPAASAIVNDNPQMTPITDKMPPLLIYNGPSDLTALGDVDLNGARLVFNGPFNLRDLTAVSLQGATILINGELQYQVATEAESGENRDNNNRRFAATCDRSSSTATFDKSRADHYLVRGVDSYRPTRDSERVSRRASAVPISPPRPCDRLGNDFWRPQNKRNRGRKRSRQQSEDSPLCQHMNYAQDPKRLSPAYSNQTEEGDVFDTTVAEDTSPSATLDLLQSARWLFDTATVNYPPGIYKPGFYPPPWSGSRDLWNKGPADGKLRYNREFLLQFELPCKKLQSSDLDIKIQRALEATQMSPSRQSSASIKNEEALIHPDRLRRIASLEREVSKSPPPPPYKKAKLVPETLETEGRRTLGMQQKLRIRADLLGNKCPIQREGVAVGVSASATFQENSNASSSCNLSGRVASKDYAQVDGFLDSLDAQDALNTEAPIIGVGDHIQIARAQYVAAEKELRKERSRKGKAKPSTVALVKDCLVKLERLYEGAIQSRRSVSSCEHSFSQPEMDFAMGGKDNETAPLNSKRLGREVLFEAEQASSKVHPGDSQTKPIVKKEYSEDDASLGAGQLTAPVAGTVEKTQYTELKQPVQSLAGPENTLHMATGECRLRISDLSFNATVHDIKHFFSGYDLKCVSIPAKPENSRYAIVEMKTAEEAVQAMWRLSGQPILDRKVTIDYAQLMSLE